MSDRNANRLFLVIALLSLALSLTVIGTGISLDDPFIGLRYARNMIDGHGLVFNAGDPPVEGYTAYFWIMVAALGMALGYDPLSFWQFVALAYALATLWLTYRLGWRSDRPRSYALVAPALLAVHVSFVSYPMTGMETTFFTFVVTLGAAMVALRAHRGVVGALALGSALFLVTLTRFDGIGLAGLLMLWILVVDRDLRAFLWAALPLVAGMALYNGWRLAFYGDPLPNTFYAKSSSLVDQIRDGLAYLTRFALRGGPFLLVVLAPIALFRRAHRTVRLSAWLAAGQLAYIVVVGGDWMPYYRFILPILPLLCLIVQETLWALIERLSLPRLLAGAAVAGVLLVGLVPLGASTFVRKPPEGSYWHPAEARWLARTATERLPADALIAVEWAGISPYYLDQQVLDIFGLSDKRITSGEFPGTRMGRGITPDFLVSLAPDMVVYTARWVTSPAEAAAIGPEIRGEGLWVTGFYSSLLEPQYGFTKCVLDLGRSRYWPVLVSSELEQSDALCVPTD